MEIGLTIVWTRQLQSISPGGFESAREPITSPGQSSWWVHHGHAAASRRVVRQVERYGEKSLVILRLNSAYLFHSKKCTDSYGTGWWHVCCLINCTELEREKGYAIDARLFSMAFGFDFLRRLRSWRVVTLFDKSTKPADWIEVISYHGHWLVFCRSIDDRLQQPSTCHSIPLMASNNICEN
jgi:hypothetical protein